jgi:Domain of unknown function (DUF397)
MSKPEEALVWVKSARCESSHCVETAHLGHSIMMRNSTRPATTLMFPAGDWSAFVAGVRAGEFDYR